GNRQPTTGNRFTMPTYEYKCEACDHAFERVQSITAAPIRKCPECGKHKVRRLLGTGAGLIRKASGLHITDYRDSNYKASARKESGATATSGASGESKSAPSTDSKSTTAAKPAASGKSGGGKDSKKA